MNVFCSVVRVEAHFTHKCTDLNGTRKNNSFLQHKNTLYISAVVSSLYYALYRKGISCKTIAY